MQNEPRAHMLRVAGLPTRKPHRFRLATTADDRARLAQDLGITAIGELFFDGEIRADGRNDFLLQAQLRATVEQPCVVTLAPVVTRIDVPVRRRYTADYATPEAEESEMPEDDTQEPLPETIDLEALAAEELSLSLPAYPRAEGADLGQAVFSPPGTKPLSDADIRPFAGLQALKDKLEGGS